MKICLVHGFNVSNARKSFGPLADQLAKRGHEVEILDYGWVFLFRVRTVTDSASSDLLERNPDVTIAHSNGNVIVYEALRRGLELEAHIAYQPAMRVDSVWPESVDSILTLYNKHDFAVRAGKVWRWINPIAWFHNHPWGTAGAHGFSTADDRLTQWEVSEFAECSRGHSYLGDEHCARLWTPRLTHWLRQRVQGGQKPL